MNKGLLVVISGPSGAGKSTVIRRLMQENSNIVFSVSATTRQPRRGERDGKDYFFTTRERFEELIQKDALLEYAEYVGNYYGTPVSFVDRMLSDGYHVILDIEVQGAAKVMAKRPDCVSIFLCPPTLEELELRLRARQTDSEDKILARLETARTEYAKAGNYDYIVINDEVEKAAAELGAILLSESCKSEKRLSIISKGVDSI